MAYHVVKVFAVGLLQSTDGEGNFVDPLLAAALEAKDSVAEVHPVALASTPEFRLRRVNLCNDIQRRAKDRRKPPKLSESRQPTKNSLQAYISLIIE